MEVPISIPPKFFTIEYIFQVVKAFNKYIFDETIRSNQVYIQCLREFDGLFPQYKNKIGKNDKHIAIIGIMALKIAPYYNTSSLTGGSKGGFNGFAIAHGTQIFMLMFFLIMLWSSCLNMHNLVNKDNIDILDPDTKEFRPIAVHDILSRPVQVGKVFANYHLEAGKQELAEMTDKMFMRAKNIALKEMDKGIHNVVKDFDKMVPKSNDGILDNLSEWTTLCMGAISGSLQDRSQNIVTTRVSNTLDNTIDNILNENRLILKEVKQEIEALVDKKVYDFNSYVTMFCRSAAGIIGVIIAIPGTAGLQRITNGRTRIGYGGKQKRKTRQKQNKKVLKNRKTKKKRRI